jgi:SpoIID/LytB domain protein
MSAPTGSPRPPRARGLAAALSLLLTVALLGVAEPAQAASAYKVTGKITGNTHIYRGGTTTVTATLTKSGAKASGTVKLEKVVSGAWQNTGADITVKNGTGSRVIYPKGTTTYRTAYTGSDGIKVVSPTFRVVQDLPVSFTVKGSGYGHGVGMAQYGAYQMALEGRWASTILKHYYTGASVGTVTTKESLRVQVFGPEPYGYTPGKYSDEKTSTTVTVTGGSWRLRSGSGTTLATGTGSGTAKTTKITFAVTGGGSTITATVGSKKYTSAYVRLHWSGTRYYATSGAKAVVGIAGAQGTYRNGRLTIRPASGKLNIVNDVLLNTEYLYGIAEMPSSWGAKTNKALAAQAIVARSYALLRPYNSKCFCDLVDDVRDQNYTGWKKEGEGTSQYYGKIWKAAVNSTVSSRTRAMAVKHDGKVVATHYFSSSGGRTESSQNVWSATVPFEQSVADGYSLKAPGNSWKSWTRSLSQAKARSLFGLTDVVSITVAKKYTGGTMAALTAKSSAGKTATITGKSDSLRSKLGLPAAWVSSFAKVM